MTIRIVVITKLKFGYDDNSSLVRITIQVCYNHNSSLVIMIIRVWLESQLEFGYDDNSSLVRITIGVWLESQL